MRSVILLAMCFALSACLGFGRKEKVETVKAPEVVDDCYTVDLFTKAEVEAPAADVPAAYSAFLGEWGKGAWNDVWCHDIMVTKVYADGRAELFEMHAPYAPWAQPATAFRRLGRIDKEGTLRFAYGTETVSYQIVDGRLEGRRSGMLGNLSVELVRRDETSAPVTRIARANPQPNTHSRTANAQRPAAGSPAADTVPPIPVPRQPAVSSVPASSVPARSEPAWASQPDGQDVPPLPIPRPVRLVMMPSASLPGS